KAGTERRRHRAGIRMFDHLDARIPSLEAIHVGWLFGSARMQTTRFATIFNVDTEDKPAVWFVLTAGPTPGRREDAQTREDDRIGRGRTRLWSADLVIIRVAHSVRFGRTNEGSVAAAAQTGALQGVKHTLEGTVVGIEGMEVHVNGVFRIAGAL